MYIYNILYIANKKNDGNFVCLWKRKEVLYGLEVVFKGGSGGFDVGESE